ncbi:10491_t:CDS:2 [Ambispora gerdemannii]|uniref:10491_t:CDS:1 n=1 Tax=Ambispora gerdemannii TaxID=144530 RepID=A0A9N8YP00_9GLOM|nr:10491_t:CDS:2 [Ambispora gerdemannii]
MRFMSIDLMKHTSEYILETGKVLKLLQSKSNIARQKILKMISIDNATNSDNIKMSKGKCTHGRSSNNRRIHDTEEKENKVSLKKRKTNNDMMLHLADIKPDPCISQNLILQVYNPIGDDFYNNVLGYDINRLMAVLLCMISGCSQEYWFYAPECAQLASDTFNIPIIVFGTDSNASLSFLPFDQKPGLRKRPIIL